MIDPFDDGPDEAGRSEDSTATRKPRFGPGAVAAAVVAVGVVGFGLGALLDSGGEGADQAEVVPDAVFDGEDNELFEGEDSAVDGESAEEPAGDPNFPPSDEHMEEDEISFLFSDQLGGEDTYGVAYVAEDGLATVGPWGVGQPTVETAHTLDQALGNPLISDGSQTWAIDDADPEAAYIVSARFEVVATELSGNLAFIRKENNRIEIGMTAYGGRQPGVQIPRLSDVVAVPGRGLLIAPATGGTYTVESDGTMSRINQDRVVSAGLDSEVYQRCDETLTCEVYAMFADSDGQARTRTLDLDADTAVTMSPDGAHVVGPASGEGQLKMIRTESGETMDLGEQTVLATGWAPDSSFLAVAVPGRMLFVQADTGDVLSIPLSTDPQSDDLLVFAL